MQKSRIRRSERGATELAQFPLAVYCMFLVLLLPLLNLISLLMAGITIYLATNDFAAKAAAQPTFAQALNAMAGEAYSFQSSNLARFVKMAPLGGYTGCGDDLYVLATSVGGTGVQSSVADQSLTAKIDTTQNIYEMQVVSSYSVAPLVSLASLPLLQYVPGLGCPLTLSFAASRPIEHPGGMQSVATNTNGTTVTPFKRVPATVTSSTGTSPPGVGTWRTPTIYQQIAAAGETVVSTNVFYVYGNQNWQSSFISTVPGQNTWMDTQAVGMWGPGATATVGQPADGYKQPVPMTMEPMVNQNEYSLMGYVGTPPPPQNPDAADNLSGVNNAYNNGYYKGGYFDTDPKAFNVGGTLTNYQLPGTGTLWFMSNYVMNPYNGAGKQLVRIIVTTGK